MLSLSNQVRIVKDDDELTQKTCFADILAKKSNDDVMVSVGTDEKYDAEFQKCMESNVKAYYFLLRPRNGDAPFYVLIENSKYNVQTNMVAEVDFDKYHEYCTKKIDNAHFTLVGSMLLAGAACYMYVLWKKDNGFFYDLGFFGFYMLCHGMYPFRGVSDALLFLGIICVPTLAVETFRALPEIDPASKTYMMVINGLAVPLWYFLWRKSFQSAFGRGLYAASFAMIGSTTYWLRNARAAAAKKVADNPTSTNISTSENIPL
jgi:hypothetical protein